VLTTLMVERGGITKAECVIGDHLKRTKAFRPLSLFLCLWLFFFFLLSYPSERFKALHVGPFCSSDNDLSFNFPGSHL